MAEPNSAPAGEAVPELERLADEVIAAHDGDARAAVTALIGELSLTKAAVSSGYSRQWHHRRNG